jgi:hypothetical protein
MRQVAFFSAVSGHVVTNHVRVTFVRFYTNLRRKGSSLRRTPRESKHIDSAKRASLFLVLLVEPKMVWNTCLQPSLLLDGVCS